MNARPSARSRVLWAAIALLVAGACGVQAPDAGADVIRLKNGETIKGRIIQDRTNEAVLVVEDYLTGGVRELAWQAVAQDSLDRIGAAGSVLVPGMTVQQNRVPCKVVKYRLTNGFVAELRGEVDEKSDPAFLLVRTSAQKEPLRVSRATVVEVEDSDCAPEDIYSPSDLAVRKREEINPTDARGFMRLGVYCERVGAYEEAKEAYENAAADDTFLQRSLAQAGAARCEAVIKDKAAIESIRDVKTLIGSSQWRRARESLDGFGQKHPDASEGVKKQLEVVKSLFDTKRKAYFSERAGKEFVTLLKKGIQTKCTKVGGVDPAFNDVQGWARKDGIDKTFEDLWKSFQQSDELVSAEEVKTFWENRPKKNHSWKFAKYGAGSFLIEPPKIKPPSGGGGARPPQRKGGQGPAVPLVLPKPPTRDEWWAKENVEGRTQFWLATIVEKSGLFEVAPKRDKSPCPTCNGEGLIRKLGSDGQPIVYLCNRCGGAQNDLTVKFR
jgi:hypothetical protein